jgi:hypothetical protein
MAFYAGLEWPLIGLLTQSSTEQKQGALLGILESRLSSGIAKDKEKAFKIVSFGVNIPSNQARGMHP